MSFCNSPRTDRTPGPITGNPINGLCEKVCIQVKKVFDACIRQVQEDDIGITLNNFVPANPTEPLTFVSCRSSTAKGIVSNVQVDRLTDRPKLARVRCIVSIPMTCVYVDANGIEGVASGFIDISMDVVMCVPEPSIIPYELEAVVSSVCPEGSIAQDVATVNACITVILKIVVETELLVPTYGYCLIPPCQEYTNQICSGFFELPLYPTSTTNG